MSQKKIAILFLDEIHHINHFVTVAIALSKTSSVSILTYPDKHAYLHKTLSRLNGDEVIIEQLKTAPFRAFTDTLKGRSIPRKGFWIKKNRAYILKKFDAIIFTDFFHRYFTEARGEANVPKFIKITHGTPGRGYSLKPQQLDFDLQLLPGKNYLELLKNNNLLAQHHAVVGYPKINAVPDVSSMNLFPNQKKIVLYNPHFSPPLSSWHTQGLQILDYFYNQQEYNLIFAPHINLFHKVGGDTIDSIPEKYFHCPTIHMDLGSEKSVDMVYINKADIYLGDVSSQVYEFIINPRACIFINAEKVDFNEDPKFRFWQCGDVVEHTETLGTALRNASENFSIYKPVQEKITEENYYTEAGSTASERAAKAILNFLNAN
ncbi:hypothetical protein ACFQO1_10960 [Jejudonia soesokkakensis]|uniref:Uncharacterized protein n=1 Tax=Jejudonia soesokkakensis TaxID=1323432 RepID=A0ABW2MWD3_9FLAO